MILILSGIMCSFVMLKLRGFKASFNLLSGKKHGGEKSDKSSDIPVLGAYRRNKEEYYVNNIPNNSPRKLTPTMTNSNQQRQIIQHSKSTSDLLSVDDIHQNTRKSTSDIPSLERERKKSTEHSKREKPPRKRDNIKKLTKDTNEQPHQDKPRKEKKKGRAPKPPTIPQHSSNILESSISRSSGPPPYSAEVVLNQNDNTGNTSFSKPLEESSWDLVLQHREQLNRPQTKSSTKPKSRVLDLNYNAGIQTSVEVKNNSEV
ncbi:uncharacterized protein LOC106715687 isoform X2 [Papilio machaon]|uniref:uncharacterized protein LOC106715687 isoform X2 n=1 Tax=Papilio machaon TaxID=76193 RepID=UPI001E662A51|nr:uncharacterized protein LOC106715687 isoform X2 [Papilio machaon]